MPCSHLKRFWNSGIINGSSELSVGERVLVGGCGCWGSISTCGTTRTDAGCGPRELTGIVDLTRGKDHPTARLLDLVPGSSGTVYKNWLAEHGEDFRAGVRIATFIEQRRVRTQLIDLILTLWIPS